MKSVDVVGTQASVVEDFFCGDTDILSADSDLLSEAVEECVNELGKISRTDRSVEPRKKQAVVLDSLLLRSYLRNQSNTSSDSAPIEQLETALEFVCSQFDRLSELTYTDLITVNKKLDTNRAILKGSSRIKEVKIYQHRYNTEGRFVSAHRSMSDIREKLISDSEFDTDKTLGHYAMVGSVYMDQALQSFKGIYNVSEQLSAEDKEKLGNIYREGNELLIRSLTHSPAITLLMVDLGIMGPDELVDFDNQHPFPGNIGKIIADLRKNKDKVSQRSLPDVLAISDHVDAKRLGEQIEYSKVGLLRAIEVADEYYREVLGVN